MKVKTPTPTRADLQRKVTELEAQLASTYHFAEATLDRAGTKYLMASGVMVRLTAIGGKELIPPVVIKDGLSDATVAALKQDIARSYGLATIFRPKTEVKT